MYHEISEQTRKRRRRRLIGTLVLLCAVALACVLGYRSVRDSMNEQAAAALRQSILDTAKQCCAIEGAYPLSLEHLETNYGLTINRDDFVVTYQAYANNVAPSVVVMPR